MRDVAQARKIFGVGHTSLAASSFEVLRKLIRIVRLVSQPRKPQMIAHHRNVRSGAGLEGVRCFAQVVSSCEVRHESIRIAESIIQPKQLSTICTIQMRDLAQDSAGFDYWSENRDVSFRYTILYTIAYVQYISLTTRSRHTDAHCPSHTCSGTSSLFLDFGECAVFGQWA
jgi:hypothetical protein